MTKIHPTAILEEGAQLGEEVEVGPYCHIGSQVTLGDRSRLHSHVVVQGPTTLGADNEIYPFSCIGGAPQDLKYKGEETTLVVGDGNVIRECVTIHRGTVQGGGITRVGSHGLFMGYIHIAHDCTVGDHVILANYTGLSGHVTVGNYVTLGGQNGVAQFTRVGDYVYTGAGSLIDRDIPPYTTGWGNRFEVKGVNIVGLKRRGFSNEAIRDILEAHRIYYRTERKHEDALKTIQEAFDQQPEIQKFLDFLSQKSS